MPFPTPLQIIGATVVVTGASSGLGRVTAHAFARAGANLVLAARGREALDAVARECTALGARTLVVPTDTRDAAAVSELAAVASRVLGRIDLWIDNAAAPSGPASLPGRSHATDALQPYFEAQGGGVLINIVTPRNLPVSTGTAPTGTTGLRRFTAALLEPLFGAADVQVYEVDPGLIDAPGLRHEVVAERVLSLVRPAPVAFAKGGVTLTLLAAGAALGLVGAIAIAVSRARR